MMQPLSVDAAPLERSTWSSRKNILFLVGGIIVVALIIVGAGSYYKRGLTTRDIAQPDKTMPPLDTRGGDNPSPVKKQQETKEYDDYEDDDYDEENEDVVKRKKEKKKKEEEEEKKKKKDNKEKKKAEWDKEDSAEYEDYDYSPDVKTPLKDDGAAATKKDKNRRRSHRKLASYATHHQLV
jgi:hypothetical protein